MSILFVASNTDELEGLPRRDTGSEARDSNFASSQIGFLVTQNRSSPAFFPYTGTTGSMWFHARFYPNADSDNPNVNGELLRWEDDSGATIGTIDYALGKTQIRLFGPIDYYSSVINLIPEIVVTLDIHMEIDETEIRCRVFVNKIKRGDVTAPKNGQGDIGKVWISNVDPSLENLNAYPTLGSYEQFWSEIIITDDEDTRNWRLVELVPDSNGDDTDFTGGYLNLENMDDDVIRGGGGDVQSWILDAYSAGPADYGIRGVISKIFAEQTADGPEELYQFLRIDSTVYAGEDKAATGWIVDTWDQNPDTEEDWVVGDFAALEAGVGVAGISVGGPETEVTYAVAEGTQSFFGGNYSYRGNMFLMNNNRFLMGFDAGMYTTGFNLNILILEVDADGVVISVILNEAYGGSTGNVDTVDLSEPLLLEAGKRYSIGMYRTSGTNFFFRGDTSPVVTDPNGHFAYMEGARKSGNDIPAPSDDLSYTNAHWVNPITRAAI